MAQEAIPLYNFYHRYKWNEVDFASWQEGMVNTQRAAMEGLFNGAVMGGFECAPVSGMIAQVDDGIAIGSSGYLMVENNNTVLPAFVAPVSNIRKDLIVIRPKITQSNPITRPESPFDTVYLKQLQDCEVVVIAGTPSATPSFPSKLAGDVILGGVRIESGQVALTVNDFNFEIREIYGKNSDFQQNFGRYDDRLRPYRNAANELGIKPSQLVGPRSRAFTFVAQSLPSKFPKDVSGNFNFADTFLNFQTGAITGGDADSPNFSPSIPTTGKWINALVAITTDDRLVVSYGLEGTRAQCIDGIINRRTTATAGNITLPNNAKLIAAVMVKSPEGTTISELEYFDYRGQAAVADYTQGIAAGGAQTLLSGGDVTLDITYRSKVLMVPNANVPNINLPDPSLYPNFKFTVKDYSGQLSVNPISVNPFAFEQIEGLPAPYILRADFGTWTFTTDEFGSGWFLI